ncbi:hypothetical protein FACS1894184_15880 [Clostridia bacterium]|nr:hypothetical protein FACS1894184_15880 [Clostridia bacterium]
MRGVSGWHYHPYRLYNHLEEANLPFICRLAPYEDRIELEWIDNGSEGPHTLLYRTADSDCPWQTLPLVVSKAVITNLHSGDETELKVARGDPSALSHEESAIRYAHCGAVPGVVINYLHPRDETYAFSGRSLCSPCILKLPSGALLASMDVFAGSRPQNLTLLFRSDDCGETWMYVNDLFPCYWATLFWHKDRLYCQSVSTEYGDLLIGVSDDEGKTFSKPVQILVGSASPQEDGWQHTPMPMLRAHGSIYTSLDYGCWHNGGHAIALLSIDENDDLLVSENWRVSALTRYDPLWPGAPIGSCSGPLEGNMVVGKDGHLYDILRIGITSCKPSHGVALMLRANLADPEEAMAFHRFIQLPSGANSKTHILYDPISGKYIAIGNICVDESAPGQRNVLALQSSVDLYDWQVNCLLLDYRHEDPMRVGFQYISFDFDGDDIVLQNRCSMNGARNFHDANYQLFHRIKDFRKLLTQHEIL